MARSLFVSYRREDSRGSTGRLYDHLVGRLGADRVFLDIDNIPPGEDFVEAIDRTLDECVMIVVVVGPRWLEVRDERGKRRIDSDIDFHRLEIERALHRDLHLVPVLVEGAYMPTQADLPGSLASFARKNAFEVSDRRFKADASTLSDQIWRVLAKEEQRLAAEAKRVEEERLAAEARRAEDDRLAAELKRRSEERRAAEAMRLEEQRRAAEAASARLEEQRRAVEAESARLKEQRRAAEAESARLEEQRRAVEAMRLEEQRRAAESTRLDRQRRAAEATAHRPEQQPSARPSRWRSKISWTTAVIAVLIASVQYWYTSRYRVDSRPKETAPLPLPSGSHEPSKGKNAPARRVLPAAEVESSVRDAASSQSNVLHLSAAPQHLCDAYRRLTAKQWRQAYLKNSGNKGWYVLLTAAGMPKDSISTTLQSLRENFPNHDFDVIGDSSSDGLERVQIAIGAGLQEEADARMMANYARNCVIQGAGTAVFLLGATVLRP